MFVTSQKKRLFFCVARYQNFAVNQKASIFVSYVIKQFAHAFSCAYIKLWMHLGSLESTQEPHASITRYSYFEKGCRKKCMRQSRKALWVALSSLFFKEI